VDGWQYVFKLTERGDRWERAEPGSDDGRSGEDGEWRFRAEQHCTIVALSESPARAGVLWAGTDDGRVWVSPDGARTWRECTAAVKRRTGGYVREPHRCLADRTGDRLPVVRWPPYR
jgi:hypothetical protein